MKEEMKRGWEEKGGWWVFSLFFPQSTRSSRSSQGAEQRQQRPQTLRCHHASKDKRKMVARPTFLKFFNGTIPIKCLRNVGFYPEKSDVKLDLKRVMGKIYCIFKMCFLAGDVSQW
jgi:hypothetical protein